MDLNLILNKKDLSSKFDCIDDQHTKRCKINTGHLCNANCHFCYYGQSRCSNLDLDLIEKQLIIAKAFGMDSVDFSGGEPTIHKDFREMIQLANNMEFKNICVITNGLTFHDIDFLKECMEFGLNDVLLSLHGINQDIVIGVDGAYTKAIQTIENANALGIRIRVNSVVSSQTYEDLPELINVFANNDVFNYNMIIFKYCFDQRISQDLVSHQKISDSIKRTIDKCHDMVEVINVRYIPFCFMRGYEKYVTNFHQKKYDFLEWNNALFFRFENIKDICLDFLDHDKVQENNNAIEMYSVADYSKADKCLRCKDFLICDGFENGYAEVRVIDNEACPNPGQKIKDPLYYRRSR